MYFHTLHWYYELIRLLAYLLSNLDLFHSCIAHYHLQEYARSLLSTKYNYVNLATLFDPDRNIIILPFDDIILQPAVKVTTSASVFTVFTRLYRFTLSDCGSIASLPTLKPNVTTSAPRLSTGSWLDLTRQDFHLLCIQRFQDARRVDGFYSMTTAAPHRTVLAVFPHTALHKNHSLYNSET